MLLKPLKPLSAVEQSIVDYLNNNPEILSTISIGDLAEATYTSKTTIVRLCKKYGCPGFREFKVRWIQNQEADKYAKINVNFSLPFASDTSPREILQILSSLYLEDIALLQTTLDVPRILHTARELLKARRIFIFAIGDSLLSARSFANRLLKIGIFPVLAAENREEYSYLSFMKDQDAALFVTYTGNEYNFAPLARELHEEKVPIYTLTSNPDSTVARFSRYCVLIPDEEKKETLATFFSQISLRFVLDLIFCYMFQANYQENVDSIFENAISASSE